MGLGDVLWWPFLGAFAGALFILAILVLVFWIWMLVDAAKRKFAKDVEKVLWIVGIVIFGWVGALVYLIVIKSLNPRGLIRK